MTRAASTSSERGITVIVPVYNEADTLRSVVLGAISALAAATRGPREVLIVNDGSTDASGAIARALSAEVSEVRLHEHPRNQGFAAAQRSGFRLAANELVFLMPADGQIDPWTLIDFVALSEEFDLVLGIPGPSSRAPRRLGSAGYHGVVRALFGLDVGDFGPCLLVRRSLLRTASLTARTPVLMTELVVHAATTGARIGELGVAIAPRGHGMEKGGRMLRHSARIAFEVARLYLLTRPARALRKASPDARA